MTTISLKDLVSLPYEQLEESLIKTLVINEESGEKFIYITCDNLITLLYKFYSFENPEDVYERIDEVNKNQVWSKWNLVPLDRRQMDDSIWTTLGCLENYYENPSWRSKIEDYFQQKMNKKTN